MIALEHNLPDALQHIKTAFRNMIAEHQDLPASHPFAPSALWNDTRKFLDFAMELGPSNLMNVRLHSGFITGSAWFSHAHQPYRFAKDDTARRNVPMIRDFVRNTAGVPRHYWCSEPAPTPQTGAVGIQYEGCLVSDDTVRYQRSISNLYCGGVFKLLESLSRRPRVLEIGGGYGGFTHQVHRMLRVPSSCVLVDLPEILFWAAVFLRINNPSASIYIYEPGSILASSVEALVDSADFVLIPNYRLDILDPVKELHLMLNLLSFQEMSTSQVETYVRFGAERLKGFLYSENFQRHWMNKDLTRPVSEILADHCRLVPSPGAYGKILQNANVPSSPLLLWALFPFFGIPGNSPVELAPVTDTFFTPYGRMRFKGEKLLKADVARNACRWLVKGLAARLAG